MSAIGFGLTKNVGFPKTRIIKSQNLQHALAISNQVRIGEHYYVALPLTTRWYEFSEYKHEFNLNRLCIPVYPVKPWWTFELSYHTGIDRILLYNKLFHIRNNYIEDVITYE